ncbi:hypothetical protein DICVIV_02277 [Dictyocaulus viviparus]|uniref:MIF4G domain-containing protein n=1 Tax=Dictyocaulus viviparus TaxID=29172 RepID=A0A0D8Y489_DICVI|nr:hypothetical protein DICVIV_02277 [Dictyocaulus viviparus]
MTSNHDMESRTGESSQSQCFQRLKRTESSISSESILSQKSSGSGSIHGTATAQKDALAPIIMSEKRTKQHTPPKKESKVGLEQKVKKVMTERELADAAAGLRALRIVNISTEIEDWIASESRASSSATNSVASLVIGSFAAEDLAETIGSALCQHAIEGGGGRPVAKVCGVLRDCPSVFPLYKGLLSSISQYFECRDRLRADHFRMWISFLAFVADLYANVGGGKDGAVPYNVFLLLFTNHTRWFLLNPLKFLWKPILGELVNFVFQVFDYLLRAPILETLKIEELESLISALLSVGYDLERECPDQLSLLKDLIRDAFINVSEPWARKMILLLLELGASGWKLPAEANEYYFQQTTN